MSKARPGIWSIVAIPALISLVVTVVRLLGEINGWSEPLFGRPEAGGGGGVLGISWLIFVFGLWFGIVVQRSGAGPAARGRALITSVLAVGVAFGGFALCQALGLLFVPDAEHPGEARGVAWMLGVLALGASISFVANRRLALIMLVYAALARIPVVVVTWIAIGRDWTTHYTKIPPGFPETAADERFAFLALPQVTFWPLVTVLLGTAMGCLGAMLVRARRR